MSGLVDRTRDHLPLAVVIGGCGGMGLACVRRLAQRHRVLLADLDGAHATRLCETLRIEGLTVIPQRCDVTSPESVNGLAERAQALGPVQSLAHVVGLSPSLGTWSQILDVNLVGAARVAEALLPTMARGGAAVFVASLAAHFIDPDTALRDRLDKPLAPGLLADVAAHLGHEPTPVEAYGLSKFALLRLVRRLASPWGSHGARIVSLSPGLIRTPMGDIELRNQPVKATLLEKTPLGRQGELTEIADAMDFLCSHRASFISGTDLLVDGGVAAAMAWRSDAT